MPTVKYEYKTEKNFTAYGLHQKGKDGWELYAFDSGKIYGTVYYFRRELEEDDG